MMVIEPLLHNDKGLRNMNDANQLHHNDALWRNQIVIFVKVLNDTASWS